MIAGLRVLSPGFLTSVQDLGRIGYQRLGIPIGGALDALSLRAANLLVGNAPDAGGLEIVGFGPTLAIEADSARVAFVGARCNLTVTRAATLARSDVRASASVVVRRGDTLRIGSLKGSATLYTAIEGGLAIEPVIGSISTYLRGGFGGWSGRALEVGDFIPLSKYRALERVELCMETSDFTAASRLRVLEGPQSDYFSEEERAAFFQREYVVGANWNRMGMQLEGVPLRHSRGYNVTSDGVVRGSIQVPGDGLPIVMLAEHQTIGGYPKIATVISADLPALGRLGSGSNIAFERVSLEEAEAAARELSRLIDRLPSRLSPLPAAAASDLPARLWEANLVSGVVDARR